ncbi:MAG TPA: signal recognition particle-docking protein FtsY, partial [Pirellulaceae bacterium]|nr:signal recognition particle-docking protein FtsY [Pirellulaceae bacterium]
MGLFDFFKKPPEPDPEKKPPTPKQPKEEEQPVGFFEGLKRALKKTSEFLNTDVRDLFKKE